MQERDAELAQNSEIARALPPEAPELFARDEAERDQDRARWINEALDRLGWTVGPRYRGATLDSYQVSNDSQRAVVSALREYANDMRAKARAGGGVLLLGTPGTGKDHLLIALARIAIQKEIGGVEWITGADLFSRLRDAAVTGIAEESIFTPLVYSPILILSNPSPVAGAVTPFQGDVLLRIVDERYRMQRPTWASINVASVAEAEKYLGAQVMDRLCEGAVCRWCAWKSYRRPMPLDLS